VIKWPFITINELIENEEANLQTGPFGTQLKASEYVTRGIPVINVRNIGYGKIRNEKLEFIDEQKAANLSVHNLKKGDIVFGRKGAVDRHALIDEKTEGWVQGSDCLRLRVKSKQVYNKYLSNYFATSGHKYWMEALCSFGATMSFLNQDIVKRIKVPLPPIENQKKIAATLSTYDDLIENNKRRIALLEKMAEEIYREWFVRMRFPGHKKVKFYKGLPTDWIKTNAKSIVDRKPFGKIYREKDLHDDGNIVVVDQSRSDQLGFYDGDPQHIATSDNPIILFGDHTCKMVLMTKPFSLAENMIPFLPKNKIPPFFLYHLIKDLTNTSEYKRHWTELTNKDVLIPYERLQKRFDAIVKINHKKIEVLNESIVHASRARNMLLGRLISGKLPVDSLDIQHPPSMQNEKDVDHAQLHL
jgi:type I restriction enzyme, S subunit